VKYRSFKTTRDTADTQNR